MKNLKLTHPIAFSLFVAGLFFNELYEQVGEVKQAEVNMDIYTVWDVLIIGGCLISLWALGYWTKSSNS